MKYFLFAALLLSALPAIPIQSAYATLIKTCVSNGKVDYALMKKSQKTVGAYVKELCLQIDTHSIKKMSSAHVLADYINLYNAATLQLVLKHYPLKSIRDIGEPWKIKFIPLKPAPISLDFLENEIIRKTYQEPRIHFALNCASIGCPDLSSELYTGTQLESQLEAAVISFLNNCKGSQVRNKKMFLNQIFQWYQKDFTQGVAVFALKYITNTQSYYFDSLQNPAFLEYDWNLNSK